MLGCSSSSGDASGAPDAQMGSEGAAQTGACHWPENLNDAGPGACTVGLAYLNCMYPSGVGCGASSSPGPLFMSCISGDTTGCPGCDPIQGGTCENKCGPGQYAVSCGGPPTPGGGAIVYQQAPAGCVSVGSTPGGNTYSCCPCE